MKTNRKYEIISSIDWNGKKIKQIKALRSFGNVKNGQFGGYVESEDNLSHEGFVKGFIRSSQEFHKGILYHPIVFDCVM
jgi:hypothetical protein